MKILRFIAGPGAGKTSVAAGVFAKLKFLGISGLDFAREGAQDFINMGCAHHLEDQLGLLSYEYRRYNNLSKNGCKVLITDTSIRLICDVYGKDWIHSNALKAMVESIEKEFDFKDIFVERTKPYITYGRVTSEEDAKRIDLEVFEKSGPFDAVVTGDESGVEHLLKIIFRNNWLD